MRLVWLCITCLPLLAACAQNSPQQYKVMNAYHSANAVEYRSTHEDVLQRAAFEFLQNMTQAQAVSFLQNDGFLCENTHCSYETAHKINSFETIFGITPYENKLFGKRHAYIHSYKIDVSSPHIRTPSDLAVEVKLQDGFVPWHRRPRPSDYRMPNDPS